MRIRTLAAAALVLGAAFYGCSTDSADEANLNNGPPPEFDPLPIRIGAAKAKDLLTGAQLTDAEYAALADPAALKGMIDTWMNTPEFETVMIQFFGEIFQQRTLTKTDMHDTGLGLTTYAFIIHEEEPNLRRAMQEMFARTALGIMQEGRPFTEVATTTRFKLNPPLMATLAYLDTTPRGDDGRPVLKDFRVLKQFPNLKVNWTENLDPITKVPVPIPFEDTINEKHPNFMRWYKPGPWPRPADCGKGGGYGSQLPGEQFGDGTDPRFLEYVFTTMFGLSLGVCDLDPKSLFTAQDWANWRWVNVRKANAGENGDLFWNIPKFRTTAEIVLQSPRVGYFSTPAFLTRWPTSDGNSFRVTANQALIVGLDRTLLKDSVVSVQEGTNASEHVKPGTPCFGCHVTLDPMRDFFRHDYAASSLPRVPNSPNSVVLGGPIPAEGVFSLGDAPVRGRGLEGFGKAIAGHSYFAEAWAHKICMWANAAPCADADPEFKRIAAAFRGSNHNFKVLLREVVSSPISTYVSRTKTSDTNGVVTGVTRREVFCQRLATRTKTVDPCHISEIDAVASIKAVRFTQAIPATEYPRGQLAAVPRDPGILVQPSYNLICNYLAETFISLEPKAPFLTYPATVWFGNDVPVALEQFVTVVMGIPKADPLYSKLHATLQSHYDAVLALQPGANATHPWRVVEPLKSTFRVACTSPLVTATGF
jgi:hypothetical protein